MVASSSKAKDYIYTFISVVLGIVTFIKLNEFTGPTFEPIVQACTDPTIPLDEFEARTGYHIYEPKVGLGIFNFLVCLITQFLLQLREEYPAGLLTWTSIIVVALPISVCVTIEAGRGGAKGPIRYPIIAGLLGQLIGISVAFPLLSVPGLILGRGDGVASEFRSKFSVLMALPALVLTFAAFACDTDSYLWTVCVGILGGPLLAMAPMFLWFDKAPSTASSELMKASSAATVKSYKTLIPIGLSIWAYLVYVALSTFGFDVFALWDAIWVNANVSVKFMTIDSIILFSSFIMYNFYLDVNMALQILYLTPFMGPGAAGCYVLAQFEEKSLAQKLKDTETKSE